MQPPRPLLVLFLVWALISSIPPSQGHLCSWSYAKHPEDCNAFLHCDRGAELVQRCPRGLHWNNDIATCDWEGSAKCGGGGSGRKEGEKCTPHTFKPHPSDCSKYLTCDNGHLVEMSCSPPLLWNTVITACDWEDNVECGGQTTTTTPSPPPVQPQPGPGPVPIGPPAPPPGEEEEEEVVDCEEEIQLLPSTPPPTQSTTTSTTTKRPHPPPTQSTTTSTTTNRPHPPTPDPTIVGIITGPPTSPPQNTHPNHDNQSPAPGYKIICYFTGWSFYRPGEGKFGPQHVPPDLCSHYVYAFAVLDRESWTIKPADSWLDIDSKFYEQMTQLKKKGRKVTIALGGWNDSEGEKYSLLFRDPVKIQTLISSVVKFVKEHDFDGVDLDCEYPVCPQGDCGEDEVISATDKNGFSVLVKGLRAQLPSGSVISAAVSAHRDIIDKAYDVRTLSESLDWIGVMDYDIHGPWENVTGHIAPLYHHPQDTKPFLNVNYSINHWIERGAAPQKLVMGVPFYGQVFSLKDPEEERGLNAPVKGPGQPGPFSRQAGILAYYEICSRTWGESVQDEEGRMGPYMVEGDQWVAYDDVSFLKKKMHYVKKHGLGGAMAWALDFDDFSNKCGAGRFPLLKAVRNGLRGREEV